jgi:hypothetical protein
VSNSGAKNLKPFPKGTSGNPKGRPPGKSIRQLLKAATEAKNKAIVDKMMAMAAAGSERAAEWCAKWQSDPTSKLLEIATSTFTIKIGMPEQAETGDEDEDA